jgi:hypothetical protein
MTRENSKPAAFKAQAAVLGQRDPPALLSGLAHAVPRKFRAWQRPRCDGAFSAPSSRPSRSARARLVTPALVAHADVIFGMDYVNEAEMLARYPEAVGKVFLLMTQASDKTSSSEIRNPFNQDDVQLRHCYEYIQKPVANLAKHLLKISSQQLGLRS